MKGNYIIPNCSEFLLQNILGKQLGLYITMQLSLCLEKIQISPYGLKFVIGVLIMRGQQSSLIPLGEVDYMNHTIPLEYLL